jgi:hypothetical protein
MKVNSIYLNGAWIGVGGNTPWRDLPSQAMIKEIEIFEYDHSDVFIRITMKDGYEFRIKTDNYFVGIEPKEESE